MKHMRRTRLLLLVSAVITFGASRAQARAQVPEPVESMPIHVGPLGLRPSISMFLLGMSPFFLELDLGVRT